MSYFQNDCPHLNILHDITLHGLCHKEDIMIRAVVHERILKHEQHVSLELHVSLDQLVPREKNNSQWIP